jgi:CTP synthase
VIEYARHVCGLNKATSREFSNTGEFVIDLMEDQRRVERLGGSMRLGSYECKLSPKTLAHEVYGVGEISERHRHRYELNNHYRKILTDHGLIFSGINKELDLVEMMEIKDHPWFLTCQFHPEFKSKPFEPHPLFVGFVKASLKNKLQIKKPVRKESTKATSASSSKLAKKRTVEYRRHERI